jgi:hypothetical protein
VEAINSIVNRTKSNASRSTLPDQNQFAPSRYLIGVIIKLGAKGPENISWAVKKCSHVLETSACVLFPSYFRLVAIYTVRHWIML